jgi:catalase
LYCFVSCAIKRRAGKQSFIDIIPKLKQGKMPQSFLRNKINDETPKPEGVVDHRPFVSGRVSRQPISRTLNFRQAGERYRAFEDWERDELISNLVSALSQCNRDIQDRMVHNFTRADADYGRRVAEGLGIPVASQTLETAGAA